jgi:hypothetical protein
MQWRWAQARPRKTLPPLPLKWRGFRGLKPDIREALAEIDDALETAGHARTDLRRRLQALEDMIAPFNPDSEFCDA